MSARMNPVERMANTRHEFGEHGGVNMSIEASSTFTVIDPETMPEIFAGQKGPNAGCYLYGRHFNPTVYNLSRQLAAMEGSDFAYCAASGMAAISAVVMQQCNAGDHIVCSDTVYGGTYALLKEFLPLKCGISTSFVDIGDIDAVQRAINERTRLIYTESCSNPTLRVADVPALADLAKSRAIPLAVDNTFTPLILNPIDLGADIVVHSLTKFIGGGSDMIGGVVCGSSDFIQSLMDLHTGPLMILGPTMDPVSAFQLSLRLPHLPVRMAEHGRRALEIARRLQGLGLKVSYPGLESHTDHTLLARLRCPDYGWGGLLTLDVGSEATANALMRTLQNEQQFGYVAVSLGYFDTLMSCSGSSTSSEMTDDDKRKAGISPGLLRMSVGITGSLEQRWTQLESALIANGLCVAAA